jgi:hypothetical protein
MKFESLGCKFNGAKERKVQKVQLWEIYDIKKAIRRKQTAFFKDYND